MWFKAQQAMSMPIKLGKREDGDLRSAFTIRLHTIETNCQQKVDKPVLTIRAEMLDLILSEGKSH